jgi:hypothetical protein
MGEAEKKRKRERERDESGKRARKERDSLTGWRGGGGRGVHLSKSEEVRFIRVEFRPTESRSNEKLAIACAPMPRQLTNGKLDRRRKDNS